MPVLDPTDPVRIDRWLFASRAFKSREMAATACEGGKVTLNGQRTKSAKLIRPGDLIEITIEDGKRKLKVVATTVRRGPAAEAQKLYEDLSPPPPPRELRLAADPHRRGRPTKRDRRQMAKLRGWDD